jgi:hypothetical protein
MWSGSRRAAHRKNSVQEEQRAPELHGDVAAGEQHAACFEGLRDGDRDAEAEAHQHEQGDADGDAFGVEPVGHPRGGDPDPPDGEQQQAGFGQAVRGEVFEQRMRELGDGEDEDEVEEQFDHAYFAAVVFATGAQQRIALAGASAGHFPRIRRGCLRGLHRCGPLHQIGSEARLSARDLMVARRRLGSTTPRCGSKFAKTGASETRRAVPRMTFGLDKLV